MTTPDPMPTPDSNPPRPYDDPAVALPATVRLAAGQGGLPVLLIDGPAARAEIYLHGANVTQWTPREHEPVLFLSSASQFARDAPIRGGVPICFPWFGSQAGHPEAPSHGFARLCDWSLIGAQDDGDDVAVRLRLTDRSATGTSTWPHPFEAVYTVVVGSRLSLALKVTNLDDHELSFEEALHTYLEVSDIRATEITGLEGTSFIDRVAGPAPGEPRPVRFDAHTDRIYLDTRATTTVRDSRSDTRSQTRSEAESDTQSASEPGRSVRIAKDGSSSTVVWNPWSDGASALRDLGDQEWKRMVCVEVCNVGDAAVHLGPGESHTMTATFELLPDLPAGNASS